MNLRDLIIAKARYGSIIGSGGSGGGGSSNDVVWGGGDSDNPSDVSGKGIIRYVAFKNHDGSVTYGQKSVVVGDDCANPISRGLMSKPTRQPDAQYNYTFYGWATTPNGAADSNALKAVNEDRTLYANFSKAVRYYTITYYDSDGTTVLKTESLAYGAMPSYVPTKENFMFSGWTPNITSVTGNTSLTAIWEEKITFASGSWEKIAEICAAGKATEVFSVGDTRPVTINYSNNSSETINFTIIDMNADIKPDGTYAALTLMAENIAKNSIQPASAFNKQNTQFHKMDNVIAFCDSFFNALPSDFQSVITPIAKSKGVISAYDEIQKVFTVSRLNLTGKEDTNYSNAFLGYMLPQKQYAHFANGATINRSKLSDSTADDYWVSSLRSYTNGSYTSTYYHAIDGGSFMTSGQNPSSVSHGIIPCVCIG